MTLAITTPTRGSREREGYGLCVYGSRENVTA